MFWPGHYGGPDNPHADRRRVAGPGLFMVGQGMGEPDPKFMGLLRARFPGIAKSVDRAIARGEQRVDVIIHPQPARQRRSVVDMARNGPFLSGADRDDPRKVVEVALDLAQRAPNKPEDNARLARVVSAVETIEGFYFANRAVRAAQQIVVAALRCHVAANTCPVEPPKRGRGSPMSTALDDIVTFLLGLGMKPKQISDVLWSVQPGVDEHDPVAVKNRVRKLRKGARGV